MALPILLAGLPVFSANAAQSCEKKPDYLKLSYDFVWPEAQQILLSNQFETGCVSPSYIADLTQRVARYLTQNGIDVKQIAVVPTQDRDLIALRLITADSASNTDVPDMTLLVPLIAEPSGRIITKLEIFGIAQEGEELIARYAVNETNYQAGGGKLRLQWFRDGVMIDGATKSRYQLQKQDVGAQISAKLAYEGGAQEMQDRLSASVTADILAANYPPRIEGLRIDGVAQTGEELVARYEFIDDNEGDLEGDTRFLWLRDNTVISGETGPSYVLGAKDIGAQITVRVEPQSDDGMNGQARSVTLQQTVAPAPVIATADVLENVTPEKTVTIATPKKRPPVPVKPPVLPKDDADQEAQTVASDTVKEKIEEIVAAPKKEAPAIIIAPKEKPVEAQKEKIEEMVAAPEKEAPAIIIAPKEKPVEAPKVADKPTLLSEPTEPNIVLTPGFEITANSPKSFSDVAFSPTAILLDEEMNRTRRAAIGTPITLAAIKTILDEINALYLDKGFELSRALLPEQIVTDGVVSIQLVEAVVGKITLENRDDLKEDFIREHLAAREGDYISLRALERSIRQYNLSNKSKLATELAPGTDFGETDIFVDVAEPDKIELPSISINNYANQTSDWRQNALAVTMNNLIGIDDETALSFSDSNGSTTISGSFSLPLDNQGTNLSVALSNSDTKVVAGSEETVGYRGSSSSIAATLSHPLIFGDDYSLYLSGTYGVSKSDLIQPVTGDMLSKSDIRKYSISAPYSYNNGTTAISVAPSWHVLNIVTKIPEREKWMQKLNIDVTGSQFLTEKWTANGRAKFLYSDARDMINMPSEILSVGGPSSVRAYQPGESSGYQGYFVSGELRTDLANWDQISLPSFMPSAQAYVFVDHMLAQSQYRIRTREDYWSGYGVGLQIPSIFNLLTFDVYWSEPLDGSTHEEEKEFYDDELFQFSLSARFRLQ